MKTQLFTGIAVLIFCAVFASDSTVSAQSVFDQIKNKVKDKTEEMKNKSETRVGDAKNTNGANNRGDAPVAAHGFYWARITARAVWKERFGKTKEEYRIYYTDAVDFKGSRMNTTQIKNKLVEYFEQGIVKQLKERGIEATFYDEQVTVYPLGGTFNSREEADAKLKENMDVERSNKTTIYTFIWKPDAEKATEETTQPKRIFSENPAPKQEAVGSNEITKSSYN